MKITILALILIAVSTFAATFYVSTSGDNGDAGSASFPWRDPQYGAANISPEIRSL